MSIEARVARHYARDGLEPAILAALAAAGKDIAHLSPDDLAPVDEFHILGRQATEALAVQMGLGAGTPLLDIGCGIGGAARYFAAAQECRVTGIDLTADYVRAAAALARRVGLGDRLSFAAASALALPFAPARFAAATMFHVGMNIADKGRLFAEARRVLAPGGVFGLFDVMREGAGEPDYPMPWAGTSETSFLETETEYRLHLEAAGFAVVQQRSRRDDAVAFFARMRERARQGGVPPLGLHLLMGTDAAAKIVNMSAALARGTVAPWEMVCRAV